MAQIPRISKTVEIVFAITSNEQYRLLISDDLPFFSNQIATAGLCSIGFVERIVRGQTGYIEVGYELTRLGRMARAQLLQEIATANEATNKPESAEAV